MSKQRDREQFIVAMAAEGVPIEVTRAVLRDAATHNRCAEAQCNGDWPYDNGERKVKPCVRCEAGCVSSQLLRGGLCPSCRAEDRITARLAPFNVTPDFQGDPRGCTVKLRVPSGRSDDGDRIGLCVPT